MFRARPRCSGLLYSFLARWSHEICLWIYQSGDGRTGIRIACTVFISIDFLFFFRVRNADPTQSSAVRFILNSSNYVASAISSRAFLFFLLWMFKNYDSFDKCSTWICQFHREKNCLPTLQCQTYSEYWELKCHFAATYLRNEKKRNELNNFGSNFFGT